jgi:peptidoglycan/xylan/chitin deacetylase (PgdA/CDA1 family)
MNLEDEKYLLQHRTNILCPDDVSLPKDKFGRAVRSSYFLGRHGLDSSPILDELSDYNGLQRPVLPDDKKAIVCLTHDVDQFDSYSFYWLRNLYWWNQYVLFRIRNQKNNASTKLNTIKMWSEWRINNYDPICTFDKWMELEDSYGFKSTFFFMSLKNPITHGERCYSIKDPKVRIIIRDLHKNGWDIGLHGSYHGNLDTRKIIEQRERLEDCISSPVIGCRHHFLRVVFPLTWQAYCEAGLQYSSNMGWSGFNGFRAGTCRPYKPLDNETFYEIPFQFMDESDLHKQGDIFPTFLDLLNKVKSVRGVLVIIVHSNYYEEKIAPGVLSFYIKVLKHLSMDNEVKVATIEYLIRSGIMMSAYNHGSLSGKIM